MVELFETVGHFYRYFSGNFDVGVHIEEEGNHEVVGMCHVDEIVFIVVVDCPNC